MRNVGLHMRLEHSLKALAEKVVNFGLSSFQCFLVNKSGYCIFVDNHDLKNFLHFRRTYFETIVVHGSYRINLSATDRIWHPALQYELALAKKMECTHFVLHAGAASHVNEKKKAIDALARSLNGWLKKERDIQIVLENTAHGKASIGSDICDFALLLKKLDQPDKISFCIDTAHAHSFGYDIGDHTSCDTFISFLDKQIGLSSISLLHLNDSSEQRGSQIDNHSCFGHKDSMIGEAALKYFALHHQLSAVPIIMELPSRVPEKNRAEIVRSVIQWHCLLKEECSACSY